MIERPLDQTVHEFLLLWPGKSADEAGNETPAVLHMLDVGAVAEVLVARLPAPLRPLFVLFAALHDLGKINAAFRTMLRDGVPQAAGRHWEVTEALLVHHDDLLAACIGGTPHVRAQLYAACAGHHGQPPRQDLRSRRGLHPMLRAAGGQAIEDAGRLIRLFLSLWPDASLDGVMLDEAKTLSWQLAGLITAADWIGSNARWFPARHEWTGERLASSRQTARRVVREAGLDTPVPEGRQLYDFALRPMQAAVSAVTLPRGPTLAFIEDETGSGKTEAAMILAQRLLLAGKARGLYFALPTMATADAMFDRVAGVLPRLFAEVPSLVLAHGRAALAESFRRLAAISVRGTDEPGPTEWLLDSRRRALLADVGVGTIDQALLAVVRAKHAPLRQFGLASKLLIVDEAHEMGDPYMGRLLQELLRVHAAQGGSAILLSATLDLGLRQQLADAFASGGGHAATPLENRAYPALSLPGVAAPVIVSGASPKGDVQVQRLGNLEEALDLLAEAAAKGAACVLIRNAVDEALSACAVLRERGVPADLLHARFALCDRKRHEAAVLSTFGKARTGRPGRVLVATQVVEASLDLDFDVMVSDLAPMASLIQRAGRLWRHTEIRPVATRAVAGPVLYVLSPDPEQVAGADWAAPVLGRGAWVYPTPLLWRTALVVFDRGVIRAPSGLRDLIEVAHGDGLPLPESLEQADFEAEGKASAARGLAGHNMIDWSAGYRMGAAGASDSDFPTRLGQPQKVLVLMRGGLPWSGGVWDVAACQLSEVSASLSRLARVALPESAPPEGTSLPGWLLNSRVFAEVGTDGAICEGLRYDADSGLFFD